jgi:hypothetical protein
MKIAVGGMMLAAASACALAQDVSNPVVASATEIFQRQSSYTRIMHRHDRRGISWESQYRWAKVARALIFSASILLS